MSLESSHKRWGVAIAVGPEVGEAEPAACRRQQPLAHCTLALDSGLVKRRVPIRVQHAHVETAIE